MLRPIFIGAFVTKKDILKAITAINEESSDLIALVDDYVDGAYSHSRRSVEKGKHVFDALQKLHAPLGIYAVLSIHDHWTDPCLMRNKKDALLFYVLRNFFLDTNRLLL